MDILDIAIAKKMSEGSAGSILNQANQALESANTASERAQAAANTYDNLLAITDESMLADFSDEIESIAVSNVSIIDDNNNASKNKKIRVNKNKQNTDYLINKNYTSTGNNEDGSMTQKAITEALNNINTNGNTSININGEEGQIVSIGKNNSLKASQITEKEIIISQIVSNTYKNNNVLGIEIDYVNKTFTRLQGAVGLNPGANFDKFKMYGGRKRCIVNADGSIEKFIISSDDVENKMVMVYQPAFYYLRVPLMTTETADGIRIDKEQLYVSDEKYPGFTLHPAFYDSLGNEVKYILRSAFESGTYNSNNNTYNLTDAQTVDLVNDKLMSLVNAIPISGIQQNFDISAAETMAQNNGVGWDLSTLENFSIDQMLMTVEYGTLNMQSGFNLGITQIEGTNSYNNASITGSTLILNNDSGQAISTTNKQDTTNIYYDQGRCAISYRGVENPYGNIWQFIKGLTVTNRQLKYNNQNISFKVPTTENWIGAFGYDSNFDWAFLPINTDTTSNNLLPVGDYIFVSNDSNEHCCVIGGTARAQLYAGIYCYGFDGSGHMRNYSARVMHTPIADSQVEENNYQLWLIS